MTQCPHGWMQPRLGVEIADVDRLLVQNCPGCQRGTCEGHRKETLISSKRIAREAAGGTPVQQFTVELLQEPEHATAQAHRALQYDVEHGLCVARRGRYRLQHVDGRPLVFVGSLQIRGALPQLIQESRVLHRDHRLGGEIFQQRDFPAGKSPHLPAVYAESTNRGVVLYQRYVKARPHTTKMDNRPSIRMPDPVTLVL